MLDVRSAEAAAEKYLRNFIRAYLKAAQSEVDSGLVAPAVEQARILPETRLGQYAGTERRRF